MTPTEVPENVRQFQETVAAGRGRNDNVLLRRGDGALVEVDFSVSVNDIGGEAYVLSIGRDVTERNRAAAALRDAQHKLQHVVCSSPAVLYSLRPEGEAFVAKWISENLERLLGYAAEDALDPDWWPSHLHPEDRDRVFADMASIFATGSVAHEYRFRNKQGDYRWLRAEIRLLRDAAGNVEAIGSWSDVSPRKDAELRLEESERQYRLLFDSNPHPMWVYDAGSLAFLAVNEAAIRHYGYSREEFLGMTIKDIRPPEDVPELLRTIRGRSLEADVARPAGVFTHRKRDGTSLKVEIESTSIPFQGWDARLVLALDVTERRSLEAQLLQSQKMESVGRLAGGVAHDFNNILGVITGYGELLSKRLPADPRLRKYTDDILKAAHRAAALTRQLLAFSRRQVLQPRILDLNSVVGEWRTCSGASSGRT